MYRIRMRDFSVKGWTLFSFPTNIPCFFLFFENIMSVVGKTEELKNFEVKMKMKMWR